ncbi:hypothetical protein [Aquimarina sp. AU58]|uniref:hypothetical protein n=1 Tax=Aquimarina sp. AU58 TaxID=1874112 RepID=UPI001358D53F|nr:hypothetical protein [Aquimarina sp. AU58]
MKNHILNLGKVLTKTQQKQINGGGGHPECYSHQDCPGSMGCCNEGNGELGLCMVFEQYIKYCNI